MNTKYIGVDLTGKKHGMLTVVRKADIGRTQWVCRCECGNEVTLRAYRFYEYRSCGCLGKKNRKSLGEHNITHGMTKTRLYHVWTGMKDRCYNQNASQYKWYGGRGIKVCEEWKNSFANFEAWALEAGYKSLIDGKSQSIDRIDVNRDYSPENCRWVNHKTQMRNTSRTVYVNDGGRKITISEFCEMHSITYPAFVKRRIKKNVNSSEIIKEWNFSRGSHDGYYTLEEASEHYSVGVRSIRKWIDKGWIKGEKIGASWYIPIGQDMPKKAKPKAC